MPDMVDNSTWMTGVVVALAMAVVRLSEVLITRVNTRRKNGSSGRSLAPAGIPNYGLTPEEHAALIRLDDLHGRYDQDGTPLWYFPRSWADILQKIVETQQEIAKSMADCTNNQKMILRDINRMDQTGRVDPRR